MSALGLESISVRSLLVESSATSDRRTRSENQRSLWEREMERAETDALVQAARQRRRSTRAGVFGVRRSVRERSRPAGCGALACQHRGRVARLAHDTPGSDAIHRRRCLDAHVEAVSHIGGGGFFVEAGFSRLDRTDFRDIAVDRPGESFPDRQGWRSRTCPSDRRPGAVARRGRGGLEVPRAGASCVGCSSRVLVGRRSVVVGIGRHDRHRRHGRSASRRFNFPAVRGDRPPMLSKRWFEEPWRLWTATPPCRPEKASTCARRFIVRWPN